MSSPAIAALVDALKAEFAEEVIFAPSVPPTITPPAVVVSPGDPFLTPTTHGTIEETWNVMVAVSIKEAGPGIEMMRDLSLRVRRVTVKQGAVWRQAKGPRRVSQENTQTVVSVNEITFKYPDPEVT